MSTVARRLRSGLARLTGLLVPRRRGEQDLADEFDSHLALETEYNLRRGMTPEEARRQAILKLGGVEAAKELYRDRRSIPMLETTLQDLRYGVRTLRKNPGFSLVAVATLALGVAINTTIFSVVSAMLLRKPPVHAPERIMIVSSNDVLKPGSHFNATTADYRFWRQQNGAFQDMAASTYRDVTVTGDAEPQRLSALYVTPEYFRILGVQAALGRTFLPSEGEPGRDHVLILSNKLWRSRFGADPAIIGKTMSLDGHIYNVIGVMPAEYRLVTFEASLWTPLALAAKPAEENDPVLSVSARLKDGVTLMQAQADMTAIARRLEERYPETNKNRTVLVLPLQEFMIRDANVRPALLVLMGAVGFVLLIGCANIANLLLARNSARQKELAIRAAAGAGRFRLIRQLLVESLLIGAAGAATGLLLAIAGTALLRSRLNWNEYVQTMAAQTTMDRPVLVFCLLISICSAILAALLPATQVSKVELNSVLSEGTRGGSSGKRPRRLRNALVVAEIALSIVLLVGAGIMIQATLAESRQPLGFDTTNVLTAQVHLSGIKYQQPDQQAAFFRRVIAEANKLPGVDRVSVASALPITAAAGDIPFRIDGRPDSEKDFQARHYLVGPDYFQTMGIPILRGRGFAEDDGSTTGVAVVNQVFAQRFFANQDPIGQRVSIGAAGFRQIIGVVSVVPDFYGQSKTHAPQIYETFLERPQSRMTIVARTKYDAAGFSASLRQAIWAVDKDQPVEAIESMTRVVDDNAAGDNFMGWMMGAFAALALVLAAVGIFGVVAYSVAQRTREIGIRIALGAGKRDILRLIVGHSGLLSGAGVGLGLLVASPLPNLLGSVFTGMPTDGAPQMLAIVAFVVAAVSLLASYLPARRATRVEPLVALRHE